MPILVEIKWVANPFQGDEFEAGWAPGAEAALDFGATWWAFFRSTEGTLDFTQLAIFPSKDDFDRYWYSDEIGELRVAIQNRYQVPILPTFHTLVGMGSQAPAAADAG